MLCDVVSVVGAMWCHGVNRGAFFELRGFSAQQVACVCNNAQIREGKILGHPTEGAMMAAAQKVCGPLGGLHAIKAIA